MSQHRLLAWVCGAAFMATLFSPWLGNDGYAQGIRPPSAGDAADAEKDLVASISSALTAARHAIGELESGNLSPAARNTLQHVLVRIRADDLLIRARHADLQRTLAARSTGLAPVRLADAAAAYRERFTALGEAIDASLAALDSDDLPQLRAAIAVLARELDSRASSPDRTRLGVALPFRSLGLPPVEPATRPIIIPAYADARYHEPAAADLAETPDVSLGPSILQQAREVGQIPIALFEFVQNEVELEFYYGSMKGAAETLRQKRGNDVDQASLLISLMRAGGIPARYVHGVITLTAEQALAWTGVSTARQAAELLAAAGVPFRTARQGGGIGSFDVEHTWVEIAVAYRNYRGAPLTPGTQTWIPLDPSFSKMTYTAGADVLEPMGFDAAEMVSAYLAAPQTLSPLDFVKQRLTSYLSQNRPDLAYEQAVGRRSRQLNPLGLLPNTLPYTVAAVHEEGTAVPESLRHRIRFTARIDSTVVFDVTLPASSVVGSRVTLSYMPETVEDQNTIDSFLGLDNTPAYLVRLRPALRVGGALRAAGEEGVQMGATHDFSIELQSPRTTLSIDNSLVAGGYYAIAFGGPKVVHDAAAAQQAEDVEEGAAELLYGVAADYLERWNQAERELADILRVAVVRPIVSEVMVGSVHTRTVLFGQPQDLVLRGIFVDADMRISEVIPAVSDDHQPRKAAFRRLSALAGSMAESEVLEAHLEIESISAAKAIQLAHAAGVAVKEIDNANVAVELPSLQTAEVVRIDVGDGVLQGWDATIPQRDIVHRAWSGIGYVLSDPEDGAAGYFISGGFAGGMTAENWVDLSLIIKQLYGTAPNTDTSAATSVDIVPVTDGQHGDVDTELQTPLAAWVRDAKGRPVQGALVKFRVVAGGGTVSAGASAGAAEVTAKSDARGLATATLKLGKKTADNPSYLREKPEHVYLTRVGMTLVSASANSSAGELLTPRPFHAFAHPTAPRKIVKVLGDGPGVAGVKGGTMLARVEDAYGNPVSNVRVTFKALPAEARTGGALPGGARNVQLLRRDAEPPCPNPAPTLGECQGNSEVDVPTSIFGAGVDPILGDTEDTIFRVSAHVPEAPAVAGETFSQFSVGSRRFGSGTYQPPKLIMIVRGLINEDKKLLSAAKVGTRLTQPLETVLYLEEDNYRVEPTNAQTCGPTPPSPPCYKVVSLETRRTRPINTNKAGVIRFPDASEGVTVDTSWEWATVTFVPVQGNGSVQPVVNSGFGVYATHLTVGPNPVLNVVNTTASAFAWVPYVDTQHGTVIPTLASLQAGQSVIGFSRPDPSGPPVPIVQGVQTVLTHDVFGVRVSLAPPAKFRLGSAEGLLAADAVVEYVIEPADYGAMQADLELFEVDPTAPKDDDGCTCKSAGLLVGSSKQGPGSVTFWRGFQFDRTKSYRLRVTLNRGSAVKVLSDRTNLAFLTGVVTFRSFNAVPFVGIDYTNPKTLPARRVLVELVDTLGQIVDTEITDETGFYSFKTPPTPGPMFVRISAALVDDRFPKKGPHVMVLDNTEPSGERLYKQVCPLQWSPTTSVAVDAFMDAGWDPTVGRHAIFTRPCPGAEGGTRAAAPFSILDHIYGAEKALRTIDPGVVFPDFLPVYWSRHNSNTTPQNLPAGHLGPVAFYDFKANELYLHGTENSATDEYDTGVILHEWTHYFEEFLSRSDSPGGAHSSVTDVEDPRLAFSEGMADAFSSILRPIPDPFYVDTSGVGQATDFTKNFGVDSRIDAHTVGEVRGLGCPVAVAACSVTMDGYYSERTVREVIWSLYSAVGLAPIYQAVRNLKTEESAVTMLSFLAELREVVQANPSSPAQLINDINNIAAAENIPLVDAFGLSEFSDDLDLYTIIGTPPIYVGRSSRGNALQTIDRFYEWPPNSLAPPFNKLYDVAFFKLEITTPRAYTIRVGPTTGSSPLDGADVAFKLRSGPLGLEVKVDDEGKDDSPEEHTLFLAAGIYTLEVSSKSPGTFWVEVE